MLDSVSAQGIWCWCSKTCNTSEAELTSICIRAPRHRTRRSLMTTWLQGAFETWLLLEYADRGALDKAVSAGRFRRKSDGTPELVWVTPLRCHQHRN